MARARAYEGPPGVVVAVDDNVRVLGGTVSMLEDLGHTAGPATSGQQAFDVVRRESDVAQVIANQGVPGMSGVERVRKLKDSHPRVRAILATDFARCPGTGRDGAAIAPTPSTRTSWPMECEKSLRAACRDALPNKSLGKPLCVR